jgi:hypothetical protein
MVKWSRSERKAYKKQKEKEKLEEERMKYVNYHHNYLISCLSKMNTLDLQIVNIKYNIPVKELIPIMKVDENE